MPDSKLNNMMSKVSNILKSILPFLLVALSLFIFCLLILIYAHLRSIDSYLKASLFDKKSNIVLASQSADLSSINATISADNYSQHQIETLYELSKNNILSVNSWFGLMLGIATFVLTVLALLIATATWLGWRVSKREEKVEKIQNNVEEERLIKQLAPKRDESKRLSANEINKMSKINKGFAHTLLQFYDDPAVYAIDEYGYKHHIPNPETLYKMGYDWSDRKRVTNEFLQNFPKGEPIPDRKNET
jgi:hypothetical protein